MTRNLFYILLASAALSLSPVAHSIATAQDSQDSTVLPKTGTSKSGSGEKKTQGGTMEKGTSEGSSTKSPTAKSSTKQPSSDTTQKSGTRIDTQQSTTSGKTQTGTDQSKSTNDNSGTTDTTKTGSTTQTNTNQSTNSNTNITVEQQTQVRQVIKEVHTQPIQQTEIKTVSVGATIPHSIKLVALPPRIVKIVPQYKSYRFFVLDDGRIVIVDPSTFTIVYVFTA
ncbi:DUF1236 domain-containing protein [Rhizobium sp. BR 317]|uniref:DUF1236 domain-containing protein n=1 Tax=Rhizobium sp. BR 317 TaxID=3040015 RepID=UPI0039BF8DD9